MEQNKQENQQATTEPATKIVVAKPVQTAYITGFGGKQIFKKSQAQIQKEAEQEQQFQKEVAANPKLELKSFTNWVKLFSTEVRISKIKVFSSALFTIASLTLLLLAILLAASVINIFGWAGQYWLIFPGVIFSVGAIMMLVNFGRQLKNLKNDRKYALEGQASSEMMSITIRRIFEKVTIYHIKANWLSAGCYLTSVVGYLLLCIIAYFQTAMETGLKNVEFANFKEFYLFYPEHETLVSSILWGLFGFAVLTFIFQVSTISFNWVRAHRFEEAFNKDVFSGEYRLALRKSANRTGFLIFITLTLLYTFPLVITYKVMRRMVRPK